MQTKQMIECFSQIHLPKLNPYYIAWIKQQKHCSLVKANKTDFMSLKQKGVISTWSVKPLQLVDQFTYFSSNILSTESDVNIRIGKSIDYNWQVITIIWKFYRSDKIKWDFFQNCGRISTTISMYNLDTNVSWDQYMWMRRYCDLVICVLFDWQRTGQKTEGQVDKFKFKFFEWILHKMCIGVEIAVVISHQSLLSIESLCWRKS